MYEHIASQITLSELKHALTQLHVDVGDDDWREFVALANDARAATKPSDGVRESQVVDADTIPYTTFCQRVLNAAPSPSQQQADSASSTARAPPLAVGEAPQWSDGARQLVERIRTALGPRMGRALRHVRDPPHGAAAGGRARLIRADACAPSLSFSCSSASPTRAGVRCSRMSCATASWRPAWRSATTSFRQS